MIRYDREFNTDSNSTAECDQHHQLNLAHETKTNNTPVLKQLDTEEEEKDLKVSQQD